MKLEKILLTLGGLAGITAFFLPYLTFSKSILGLEVLNASMSGYSLSRSLLDAFGILGYEGSQTAWKVLQEVMQTANGTEGYLSLAGLIFVFAGPFLFLAYSLGYFFRGLMGRQYKHGIFFTLIYAGLSWLTFYLISTTQTTTQLMGLDVGVKLEFFSMAGVGFWVAVGGMLVAAFSLFFAPMKTS